MFDMVFSWLAFGLGKSRRFGGVLSLLAVSAHADVRLHCTVTYAGAMQTVLAEPVQDAYRVAAVDVRNRFRFKAVLVGEGERVDRVNLYVYQNSGQQPVMVQHAKYLPPFAWPTDGRPLALTGQQHVYAGPLERELMYSCTLARERP